MISGTMDLSKIAALRKRGFLEAGPNGEECVRLSVQQRGVDEALNYPALKRQLETWVEKLREDISAFGGDVVPDTLSTSGQTVEALIPVTRIHSASAALESQGVRLDFVEPRQIV